MLPNTGSANPGVRVSWDPYTETNIQQSELVQRHAARFVMGTTDPPKAPKQQPQSDDCWPWMGTSKPAKSQRQTGHGIQNHIWAHLHPSVTVSASSNIEHQVIHYATCHSTAWQMSMGINFPPLPSDCRTSNRKASWLPQPGIFGLELASQDLLFLDCFILLLTCTLF